jgi:hypothetical protein
VAVVTDVFVQVAENGWVVNRGEYNVARPFHLFASRAAAEAELSLRTCRPTGRHCIGDAQHQLGVADRRAVRLRLYIQLSVVIKGDMSPAGHFSAEWEF